MPKKNMKGITEKIKTGDAKKITPGCCSAAGSNL
jgi:hypothetical protein